MSSLSSFLFARPSFIEGIARVFDLGNTLQEYNVSKNEVIADQRAMAADWRSVGLSIETALNTAFAEQGLPRVQQQKSPQK